MFLATGLAGIAYLDYLDIAAAAAWTVGFGLVVVRFAGDPSAR